MIKLPKACSKFGAQMARPNICNHFDRSKPIKLHLVRLKWVDHDYDEGGAYWGNNGTDFVFWAYNEEEAVSIFFRAEDRKHARGFITEYLFPLARFFN